MSFESAVTLTARSPERLFHLVFESHYERMTADNNSTEDKPDPTPFKVYPDERAQQAHAGRARQGNLPPRSRASSLQVAKSAGTTRFISAAGKFGPSDRGYL